MNPAMGQTLEYQQKKTAPEGGFFIHPATITSKLRTGIFDRV